MTWTGIRIRGMDLSKYFGVRKILWNKNQEMIPEWYYCYYYYFGKKRHNVKTEHIVTKKIGSRKIKRNSRMEFI